MRAATPTDLEEVVLLASECDFVPQWSRAVWEQTLASADTPIGRRVILVASTEGQIVGVVVMHVVTDVGEIENLAVLPAARRQGIAKHLCAQLFRRAQALGLSEIALEVRSCNRAARSLYLALGFTQVGERRGYYSHPPDDAIFLVRSFRR